MTIAVGVRCVGRAPATIWRTIASLDQTGFTPAHFFVDGPFEGLDRLAGHGPVTWHAERVGGWPNFLLALTELHLRRPDAEHYLLVEDDVVFCRDVAAYLERKRAEAAERLRASQEATARWVQERRERRQQRRLRRKLHLFLTKATEAMEFVETAKPRELMRLTPRELDELESLLRSVAELDR